MGRWDGAVSLTMRMGEQGEDNRILWTLDGTYSKTFDQPAWFTRWELAQNDSGAYLFTWWDQRDDAADLQFVIEIVDCDRREDVVYSRPMRRPRAGKYPALMKPAGDMTRRPTTPLVAPSNPRYADWDLQRFLAWASWKAETSCRLATAKELTSVAGLCLLDGERAGTWTRDRRRDSPWPPTREGVRTAVAHDLGERGHRSSYGSDVGGPATFIAMWWTEGSTTTLECGPHDSTEGLGRTITSAAPKGMVNRLVGAVAGGHRTTITDPQPIDWTAPAPAP